jgi:hypothetical protein
MGNLQWEPVNRIVGTRVIGTPLSRFSHCRLPMTRLHMLF